MTALRQALERLTEPGSGEGATLSELFGRGVPVARADLDAALAPAGLEDLERAGLVEVQPDGVAPAAQVSVFDGLMLFGDRRDLVNDGDRDAVTPLSPSSVLLANLTVRRPVRRALDLGTGSGCHAMLAARHCDHVTAIDINERALRFARLNADLNGAGSVRVLHGSWFEPLAAGERFDLIVGNIPFVPAPEVRSLYRDSPVPVEELVEQTLTGCLDRLTEGGLAHLMIAWTRTASDSPIDFPTALLRGRPCDSLLFRFGANDAKEYAEAQMPPRAGDDDHEHDALIAAYADHYDRNGIELIETAHLVVRRRDAPANWRRTVRLRRRPAGARGEQVDRMIRAQYWLGQVTDDRVMQTAYSVPEYELVTSGAGATTLRSVPDIGFSGALPGEAERFLDRVARSEPIDDPAMVPYARNLVGLGFLEPV